MRSLPADAPGETVPKLVTLPRIVPLPLSVALLAMTRLFENAWVPHSGGLVYVIHPADHPLPPVASQPNW